MYIGKKLKKILASSVILGSFMLMSEVYFNDTKIVSIAHAEVKTYEGVGEYVMSDFETPDTAKQRAKVRAEQNAQELRD